MPNWRNYIKVHPAADLFPCLSADEMAELATDIEKNGLRIPVVTYTESGITWLLDGRNRLDALEINGGDVKAALANAQNFAAPQHDPWELVVGYNIHRRHLTSEQKREVIARLLQAQPERSNTDTARLAHVDPKTVGAVRAREEAKGAIPRVTHTVGHDGRIRTATPAPRAKRNPPASPTPSQARDNGAVAVSALLTRDVAEGLADIIRAISGHTGRIERIDPMKREELVDRFATALALIAPSRAVEAARAVPTSYDKRHCSFCGEPHNPTSKFLYATTGAGICETCVDQLARRLRTERQEKSAEFGLMVRDARKARKLSQEALAKMVGLAQVQISLIEAGKAVPTREQALRIARCLKLDPTPDAEPAAADPQPEPESKATPQPFVDATKIRQSGPSVTLG